jgi:hypothetical protein
LDRLYLDLNVLIDIKSGLQITHVDFYEYYYSKLGIDPQSDPILLISPLDTDTLRAFLSDIIDEYNSFDAKYILEIENLN